MAVSRSYLMIILMGRGLYGPLANRNLIFLFLLLLMILCQYRIPGVKFVKVLLALQELFWHNKKDVSRARPRHTNLPMDPQGARLAR